MSVPFDPPDEQKLSFREQVLRTAAIEYEARVQALQHSYTLALWAARALYKQQIALVEQNEIDNALVDPLTGRPLREAGLLPWDQSQQPVEPTDSQDPQPYQPDPIEVPVSDTENLAEVGFHVWQLIQPRKEPFVAKQLLKDFNTVYPQFKMDYVDLRRLLRQYVRAGSLVEADWENGPDGKTLKFYQLSTVTTPIEQGAKRIAEKIVRGESLAMKRPTPRKEQKN